MFAENPVRHIVAESKIAVIGNIFSLLFTKQEKICKTPIHQCGSCLAESRNLLTTNAFYHIYLFIYFHFILS